MIITLQMLIVVRESILALLNGWLPPFFTQLLRQLSDNRLIRVKEEIEDQVYADYDDECGVEFFPPVYAQRYAAVCDCLMDEQWFGRVEKVLNIGKHYDIHFLRYLTEVAGVTQILGLDIAHSLNCTCDIRDLSLNYLGRWETPLQITLLQGNAADPDYRLIGCDAVIAIEMIQKLLPHDLDRLIHNVFGFVKPWVVLFTTPNADFNCLMKNLNKNGLRQSDHYFEWTREQLHDWCSNIVMRYPEYMVMSRGIGPGPPGTSHYGCFSQLVLFISKHYYKKMELDVNSLVMVSNLPEPEEVTEIDWISPKNANISRSTFQRLFEAECSEFSCSQYQEDIQSSSFTSLKIHAIDSSVQCNLEVEFGKKFVMFDYDQMYKIKTARKIFEGDVYEIGDVASRLNNTILYVRHFSKITQYLMEKIEFNKMDWMDEILQLMDQLSCKINHRSGDECHVWNNVNWGENVPYWNQYYKVVGVYKFPYEGRSEEDVILEVLSEEINKFFDMHGGGKLEIPVEALMDAVKHITDDVEKIIMLMEDSGYELQGKSVVYTGDDVSKANRDEECDSSFDSESVSYGSSIDLDFNGRLLNRTLGHKIKKLRLMLPQEEDIKQAICQVVCRLKKIAMSSGLCMQGPARSKWLQSKLLELLTMTEKSILRKNLCKNEIVCFKSLGYDMGDNINRQLSRIKAEDDAVIRLLEKYETILRMSADNTDEVNSEHGSNKSFPSKVTSASRNSCVDLSKLHDDKEFCKFPASETTDLSLSPNNDELRRYTLEEQHTDSLQDWGEKDMSLYQEETNEIKIRKHGDKSSPKQSKLMKSRKDNKGKTKTKTKKRKITDSPNSSFCKKKSKHSATLIAAKRSLVQTSSKVLDRKNDGARHKTGRVMNKLTYNHTLVCIDTMRRKMGPTLVLSVPPKPIPGSILDLCHPHLHHKTAEPLQKIINSWDDEVDSPVAPVAATEHSQRVEILSQSETVMVALQRMIGTDPDVDVIYEHELELSDLNSLLNNTSYFAHTEKNPSEAAVHDPPGIGAFTQESTSAPQEMNPFSCILKTRVVEIVTQDGQELIALQRTIGTDPELYTDEYEQELENSKLTTSLNNMASFENLPVGVGNATSKEFFLYDLNEATTSKGIRHVSMDVQCGTERQISATTSFTCPLNMFGPALEIEGSNHDFRAVLKNDCVTSTHDILKPCEPKASPWMKSVGIKIKDSNHEINDTSKETETLSGSFTIVGDEFINIPKNCALIETLHPNLLVEHTLDYTKKNNMRTRNIQSPNPDGRPKWNEIKKQDSNHVVSRIWYVPKRVRSKLSCGSVHVHSYKDLQESEDVVYQGKWQRPRPYRKPKKPNQPSTDKLKFTRKTSVSPIVEKPIVQKTVVTPIIIRNTKANKMKEAVTKMHIQAKLAPTKQQLPKNRTVIWQVPKATSKSNVSYSKPIKAKSNKIIQPPRNTIFASQPTIIKENTIPITQKRKVYIPPYLEKIKKKHQVPKKSSKIEAKSDSQSNLLNITSEQITSIPSESKVENLLSAFLKVSIKPPKDVNYVVYRNEMENSDGRTAIENMPVTARPQTNVQTYECTEDILRRKLSNLSNNDSAYSSTNSAPIALNPVITNIHPFQSSRKTTAIKSTKSSINREGTDSKMVSRIKKLTNLMFSKKSHTNVAERLPKISIISKNCSKMSLNVDLLLDEAGNNDAPSEESKCSVTKTFFESSDSKIRSCRNDKQVSKTTLVLDYSESNTRDLKTGSGLDCSEAKSDTQESSNESSLGILDIDVVAKAMDNSSETITDRSNDILDDMRKMLEECLNFKDKSEVTSVASEDVDLKSSDFDNVTPVGSETYETSSSFHRTCGVESLLSLTQSFTNFSYKSQPSASRISESIPDASWYNVAHTRPGSQVQSENKDTIRITQKPKAGLAFSSFSVNAPPSPLAFRQQPDYVNLVDSETGSCAQAARRATSEEVLVSGRSSESFVSCAVEEEPTIPSWLYNISQQASGSFSSSRHAVLPEVVPELVFDLNGNELTVHGAGAGDGCGIHSDQSQDSSGQGTSFSSTASSTVHSDSIVVDPASFLADYSPPGERSHSPAVAPLEESIETLDIAALENQNRPLNRNRIPRSIQRVSLPASDADISSIDTDVASD
ncbi:uncharacterized protein LOC134804667 isoform X2 [Cydia splendana]|uniref:uncharacterized protein LOC134804667 isoform X2 n=1 Tax=Cydia splendana TaxID=1100963 RepID=UPI00300D20E4